MPFDADKIRVKYQDKPNWPLQSFDAQDWAKAFMKLFGDKLETIDEGLMLSWFANALMRGWDEKTWRVEAERASLETAIDNGAGKP